MPAAENIEPQTAPPSRHVATESTTLSTAVAAAFVDPGPLLEHGASARLCGEIWDPEDGRERTRHRTLPTGPSGPGVLLSAEAVRRVVRALQRDGAEQAAEVFLNEFGDAYGFWPGVGGVRWLRVWPDGTPEPV